jgi:Holliday junction resolvase RusA-like endonuclease
MTTEFFLAMAKVPTMTHQQKEVNWDAHQMYEPMELKAVRAKMMAKPAPYKPAAPYTGAVRLMVKWCFPATARHRNGEYKTSRPDTDNLQKMLKDCMTDCHYWKDDAQVASEIIEKFWAECSGIYIRVESLEATP